MAAVIVSKSRRTPKKSESKTTARPAGRRRVTVLVSLVAVLTFTSALLLALAPAPLNPQASTSLFAIADAPQSMDDLFDRIPAVPVRQGRWNYVYVHHSLSLSGSAQAMGDSAAGLGDHFVIGNGDGCADGEIQVGGRWVQQADPGRTPGAESIRPDCISICLVGDFNQSRPTPTQRRRLVQLVNALQARLHIPAGSIYFDNRATSEAGIGAYFPAGEFRSQLLP